MADSENIGSIAVEIVGDYSKLQQDIDGAAQVAAAGGQEIASALNAGAAGADALSGAVSAAALGLGSFESQIQALVDSGSTLAEALAAVGTGAEGVATGVETAGAAAAEAAAQMELFDAAIEVPYADAAGQLNLFATEMEPIAAAAHQAAAATEEVAHAAEEAGQATHEAAIGGMSEFREKLIAFAEATLIVETLRELGLESLHAADNITRASISLTALTGSGEKAESTIKAIEQLGNQDGLSLPSLLQASTRMTALLGASAPVPELLAKIADGAAVMGKDIGAAADAFDRLATMGTLGARQLLPLGLTLDKVAESMNAISGTSEATAENASKMFKALDQADRVKVLSATLDELSGIAQETAEKTFGGQWQILANEWEQIMRSVGDAILPVITNLTNLAKTEILPFVKSAVDAFNELPAPVKEVAVMVGLLGAAIIPVTLAVGGLGIALAAAADAIAPVAAAFVSLGSGITGVGASYTAMMAAGVASVAVWVGLAIAIADVVAAYISMARAEDLAATSQVNASKSLQEYEARLIQHGIDISALKAQYDSGRISTDQYIASLGKLRDSYLAAHPVILEHAAATVAVLNPTEALGIKMQALAAAVTATRDKLAATTQAYNEHKASADDVAKAYDAWQTATNALTSSQKALLPVVTDVHHATKEFVATTLAFPDAAKAAADATDALGIKIGAESMALAEAQRWLDTVMQKYRDHNATAADVAKALDLVNQKQAELNATMGKLPDIATNLYAIVPPLTNIGKAFQEIGVALPKIPPGLRDVDSILGDMGIKLDDVHNIFQNKLLKDYDDLQKQTHTIDEENAAWERISGSLNKIAKNDLPLVLKLYDEHIAQLVKDGAAQGVLFDWQEKRLQAEIAIKEQSGASATAQIIQLQNIKIQQQALYDQTHMLGDLYKSVTNDILKGWNDLGKSVADNIIEEKNWGDVFTQVAKQVGKTILEDIVGTYFKALKNAILGVNADTNNLSSTFVKLGQTISKVFGGGGGSGELSEDGVPIGNAIPGGVSGGAKKAQSILGGGGAGGTLGAIDAITGIGTLISSIFGNFQMARLETTMNAVEHNTRFLQIEAEKFFQVDEWDRYTGTLNKMDDIWNAIRDVSSEVTRAGLGIMGALGAVPQFAAGGYIGSDMLARLHAGEVVIPRTDVPLLPRLPSLPQLSSPGAGTYTSSTSSSSSSIGSVQFVINGATNPRETVRQISDTLKSLSPGFAAYAT